MKKILCWLFHSWERVTSIPVEAKHFSVLFSKEWVEKHVLRVEECRRCGRQRALIIDFNSPPRKVPMDLIQDAIRDHYLFDEKKQCLTRQ